MIRLPLFVFRIARQPRFSSPKFTGTIFVQPREPTNNWPSSLISILVWYPSGMTATGCTGVAESAVKSTIVNLPHVVAAVVGPPVQVLDPGGGFPAI